MSELSCNTDWSGRAKDNAVAVVARDAVSIVAYFMAANLDGYYVTAKIDLYNHDENAQNAKEPVAIIVIERLRGCKPPNTVGSCYQ